MNIVKSHAILIHFHTLRIGILTSGIKYVNVKMGDYDLREILKELRQMMNEVSKKVKVFSKSHKAVKEFSKLKEDTKASTEKKELSSPHYKTQARLVAFFWAAFLKMRPKTA